jgi:hypothetical protein
LDGVHLDHESDAEEGLGMQIAVNVRADIDDEAVFKEEHDGSVKRCNSAEYDAQIQERLSESRCSSETESVKSS